MVLERRRCGCSGNGGGIHTGAWIGRSIQCIDIRVEVLVRRVGGGGR